MPVTRRVFFGSDAVRWRTDATKGVQRSTLTLAWMALYGFVTWDLLLGIGSAVILGGSMWYSRKKGGHDA